MRVIFPGLALLPPLLVAQEPAVTWDAGPPRQGSFAYLSVAPGGERPMNVHGTLDGVPLQFEPVAGGRFTALAGVALDAGDSVSVAVRLAFPAGRMERFEVR